jgi:hypothetical protein
MVFIDPSARFVAKHAVTASFDLESGDRLTRQRAWKFSGKSISRVAGQRVQKTRLQVCLQQWPKPPGDPISALFGCLNKSRAGILKTLASRKE